MSKYDDIMGGIAVSKGYSIRVRIGGKEFGIISNEKPEYLTEIAHCVDNSITSLLRINPEMTYERAAVLSALKFCDNAKKNAENKQTLPENSEDDNLRRQVIQYANELSEMTQRCKKLEKELKEKNITTVL